MLTSLGVLIGLILVTYDGTAYWDPVAALCVCLLILRVGYGLAARPCGPSATPPCRLSEERV